MKKVKAVVLGAGVTGLSVALAARQAGWSVDLVTDRLISQSHPSESKNYDFTSLYPGASIIPHYVAETQQVLDIYKKSHQVFAHLANNEASGIRYQNHMEVYEEGALPEHMPDYLALMDELEEIDSSAELKDIYRRTADVDITGHKFRILFANMPTYAPWLENAVIASGVNILKQKITKENLTAITEPYDVALNCMGCGAYKVFPEDLATGFMARGYVAQYQNPSSGPIKNKDSGDFFSWNYTPKQDVFSLGGRAAYIFCYPRYQDFLVGGLRQIGLIDPNTHEVEWEQLDVSTRRIGDIDMPEAIMDINAELIEQSTGYRPKEPSKVYVGYRHLYGTPDKPEICLQTRQLEDKPIVDALGFGGAGVTLSWGIALEVVQMAEKALDSNDNGTEVSTDSLGAFLNVA